jgi:hypothetical protein
VLAGAMLTLTAVNPRGGLFALMGVLPLATPIQILTKAPTDTAGAELILLPFLVGAGMRLALGRDVPLSRLARPAAVLGTIIAGSAIVGLAVDQQATGWLSVYLSDLWRNLLHEYFVDPLAPLPHIAMAWLEGLALAVWAECLLVQAPNVGPAAARMALTGMAAAGVFSAIRLAEISLRAAHPWSAAAHFLWSQRLAPLHRDLNAAGSYYALGTVPAFWLAARPRAPLWWGLLAAPLGLALWLAGSRAALAGTVCGLAGAWLVGRRFSGRVLLSIGAVALALAVILTSGPGRIQASPGTAFTIRRDLAAVSLRIAATHPAFGVGVGQFSHVSVAFISADLVRRFHVAAGENAHNNFLQILAELGGVGLLAFGWLLAVPARAALHASAARTATAELLGLSGGLLALLVTCLLGHPFLSISVLLAFLLVLGVASGLTPTPAVTDDSVGRVVSAVAIAAIVVSVPFRAIAARRAVDLDNVSIGASVVVGAVDGLRYRLADARSAWFVSAHARVVDIALRLAPESAPGCQVSIAIDGHQADVVSPSVDNWLQIPFTLPPPARGVASRRFDLRVTGETCRLMVGPVRSRD